MPIVADSNQKSSGNFHSSQSRAPLLIPRQISEIIARAVKRNGVSPQHIYRGNHEAPTVRARRQIAAELSLMGLKDPTIARYIGLKSHTSVRYLLGKDRKPGAKEKALAARIDLEIPIPDLSGEWNV